MRARPVTPATLYVSTITLRVEKRSSGSNDKTGHVSVCRKVKSRFALLIENILRRRVTLDMFAKFRCVAGVVDFDQLSFEWSARGFLLSSMFIARLGIEPGSFHRSNLMAACVLVVPGLIGGCR